MTTLSHRLAAHVAETPFELLPATAIEAAKRSLLDAIGVSLGASGLEPSCAAFVDFARTAKGAPESSILGFAEKAPAHLAAFANGALAHALDFEDAFDGAPLHPNAALIPAALALAQARGGVNGREFLAALALGCDLVCRLALSVRTPMEKRGWYPPPIFAAYGGVASAGRVLRLSAEQMVDAFSLALSQATCSGEIKNNPQSAFRAIRDAFPAQAGVVSADLAQRGVRGFAQPFEGEFGFFRLFTGEDCDTEKLVDRLGERFLGAEVSFKRWPSCRGTHAYIELALTLRAAHGFQPEEVEHVSLRGGELQLMLMNPIEAKRAPTTAIDAKFSLPFVVATALRRNGIGLEDFAADRLRDPATVALARRVAYEPAPEFARKNASAGAMDIQLADGRRFSASVEEALGGLSKPMSWDDLLAKAKACARYAHAPVSAANMDRLGETIATLEHAPDAASALMDALAYKG